MDAENTASLEYLLDEQIGFKLRLAQQKHLELFVQGLPEATPTQFAVLARLLERGPMSQNQLGRSVGMDAATIKGVVDRLRRKGWVKSTPSLTDLRRLDISLTPEGAAFSKQAIEKARKISAKTTANLSPRETERLLALLGKL